MAPPCHVTPNANDDDEYDYDDDYSAMERDDIAAEKTSFRTNEKLLSALSRKSVQQFQLFLDALDNCGQSHVRNDIDQKRGLLHYKTTTFGICNMAVTY